MSELTNTPKMDPGLFSYLKTLLPMLDDKGAVDLYESTKAAAAKQGVDISAQPPAVVAKMFKQVVDASASAQKPAQTAPLIPAVTPPAPADPQVINVTGQRLPPTKAVGGNFGTGPQGVVAGTQATDAQFGAPGATSARLNASADPAEMEAAARQKYHLQGGDSLLQRLTGGIQAATASGVGGAPMAYADYQKRLNDIDTAFTTGLVDAKQAANLKALAEARAGATAAQVNSAGAQKQAQEAAQFGAEQVGRVNTAALSNQGASAALELGDPESPTAKAALQQASPILRSMGIDPKHFAGMPASTIIAFVANTKPTTELQNQQKIQAQKDFELITGRIGTAAGANLNNQQAAGVGLTNQITGAVTGAAPGVSPAVIKQNVQDSGMNWQGGGLAPSPATTTAQTNAAQMRDGLRTQIQTYDTSGAKPSIDGALKILGTPAAFGMTGNVGQVMSKFPGKAQELKIQLANVIAQQLKIQSQGPGGGSMGTNIAQEAEKQANDIMNMSTKQAVNRLIAIKGQHASNLVTLNAMDEYQKKNGGRLDGFVPPSGVIMFNPRTNDTELVSPDAVEAFAKKGWKDTTTGVYK